MLIIRTVFYITKCLKELGSRVGDEKIRLYVKCVVKS